MDEELKAYLGEMEARFKALLDGRLDALEVRLKEHNGHSLRDMETKVISEFWKWGRTHETRARNDRETVRSMDDRLVMVEDRVAELERRTYKAGPQ